ncbi:hypothetical protein F0344_21205 [Streptomyces finlayi]|uniref:Uncharacterized protein n=1 Tax=Streptomyces finlayi TaxID=67296 RepID=A0A7G7BN86_9ACTN|nr:hypothetical protein [Streptomyces finlayi]QNE76801.1 hypothetical protein F0344_21205 [Streptomyces finlayi]
MARTTSDTDARRDEYATFAPTGETCPECDKPIAALAMCRRGTVERQSGPPVVVYRHSECAKPYLRTATR